jgi:hypothetical protein
MLAVFYRAALCQPRRAAQNGSADTGKPKYFSVIDGNRSNQKPRTKSLESLGAYSESPFAPWISNQDAPPNGLWLAKSGRGGKYPLGAVEASRIQGGSYRRRWPTSNHRHARCPVSVCHVDLDIATPPAFGQALIIAPQARGLEGDPQATRELNETVRAEMPVEALWRH